MNVGEVDQWYYRRENVVYGPVSTATLFHTAEKGKLAPNDLLRRGTCGEWSTAMDVAALLGVASFAQALSLVPHSPIPTENESQSSGKRSPSKSNRELESHAVITTNPAPWIIEPIAAIFDRVARTLTGLMSIVVDILSGIGTLLASGLFRTQSPRSLFIVGTTIVVALIGWGGVSLYQSLMSNTNDLAYLNRVYLDFCGLRDKGASALEFENFVSTIHPDNNAMVKRLERTASSQTVGSRDILWAARDYLPSMLNDARHSESRSEIQFRKHLKNANPPAPPKDRITTNDAMLLNGMLALDACLIFGGFWIGIRKLLRTKFE